MRTRLSALPDPRRLRRPGIYACRRDARAPARATAVRHVRLRRQFRHSDATVIIAEGVIAAAGPDARSEGAAVVGSAGIPLPQTPPAPAPSPAASRTPCASGLTNSTCSRRSTHALPESGAEAGVVTRRADLLSPAFSSPSPAATRVLQDPDLHARNRPQKFIDERLAGPTTSSSFTTTAERTASGSHAHETDLAALIAAHNRGRMARGPHPGRSPGAGRRRGGRRRPRAHLRRSATRRRFRSSHGRTTHS